MNVSLLPNKVIETLNIKRWEVERWEVEREESMKRAERKFFDIIREERESRVAELNSLMSISEKEL